MTVKKISHIIIVATAVTAAAGCALQKDVYSLESRQTQLERRTLRMEEQLGGADNIKAQIEQTLQGRQDEMKQLRTQYAALKAEVDSLHDEVNRLRGGIEEAQFNKSKTIGEAEQIEQKASQKVDILSQDLEQTKNRLAQLEAYLDMGQPARKDEAVSSAKPRPMTADQALYDAAKAHFDQGRMNEARDGFLNLLKSHPKSPTADNAQFWVAETYFQQKWYEKSILEYQKVIETYPKGNKVPAALLKQGMAFQKIGDKSNAKLILKELTQKYPASNEGKIAAEKLKEI